MLCRTELERAGFNCADVPFEFSQWPGRWGPPLAAVFQAATILVVARTAIAAGPLSAILAGAALFTILFFITADAKRRWIVGLRFQRARSVNLEARRGNPKVWLMAHLDSKSQTVPMLVRIASSVALAATMCFALVILLLSAFGVGNGSSVWSGVQLATVIAALPAIFCFVRNDSTGAVDNASGVVAVLLAARSSSARDLGVLITSGEELGLAGARIWTAARVREDPEIRLMRVLNCDTVDDAGDWRSMYTGAKPKGIAAAVESAAGRLTVPLAMRRLIPGILADSMALADRGIEAVTLGRGTLSTLARIHTRRDNSNALTGQGAAEASVLLSALAKELS
jgi:hypothetical protein